MRILHLSTYYCRQKIYGNLITELNKLNHQQVIYCPVRRKSDINKNTLRNLNHTQFFYPFILSKVHKIFYSLKIKKTFSELEKVTELSKIDIAHAHTLFSDGGVAYKAKRKYGTPYIVSIRNTDLKILEKVKVFNSWAWKILQNSEFIIFINPSYQDKVLNTIVPNKFKKEFGQKSHCIPNGINNYWHLNKGKTKHFNGIDLNILFVGTYLKLKNIPLVVKTATMLSKRYRVVLTLVGGGGRGAEGKGDSKTLTSISDAKKRGLNINEIGRVESIEELSNIYQKATIFLMPSRVETFGLVYVEALSQGVPIVYTNNQGISGFFQNGQVGQAVDIFSPSTIANQIQLVLEDYESYSKRAIESLERFYWPTIAQQYNKLYEKIISNKFSNEI